MCASRFGTARTCLQAYRPRHGIGLIALQGHGRAAEGTGLVPNTLEKRTRSRLPHRSGLMIIRKVWFTAPLVVAFGNAMLRSGCGSKADTDAP